MHVWEGIRLAMVQIWTEKLKSLFSLLGVIIGVMFLIVVVSIVEGMDQYIREDFSSQIFGINTVTIRRQPAIRVRAFSRDARRIARNPQITFEDAEFVSERLDIPHRMARRARGGGTVTGDNGRTVENAQFIATDPDLFEIQDWVIERGRAFSPQESEQGARVVVIGYQTAEVLFPGLDPLGRTIRVDGTPFQVIGVMEEEGSLFGESLDNRVVAPIRSPLHGVIAPRRVAGTVVLQVDDPSLVRDLQAEVEGLLRVRRRLRPNEDNNFEVETADDSLSFWDTISTILFTALPGLVAISLVVGGVVIMNIMLVSVMERTREIGVRKALGARRRDILTQVLIESATLTTVGAGLGVAVGLGLASTVAALTPLPAGVSPFWITVGVLLGTAVGVFAGVYPASRASRLHPVDALRYE